MTTTVSTPSVIDTRTDDFRAVLSNFKLFKNEEGSHWTFAGDTSLTNLDTSMQVTLQHLHLLHTRRPGTGEIFHSQALTDLPSETKIYSQFHHK